MDTPAPKTLEQVLTAAASLACQTDAIKSVGVAERALSQDEWVAWVFLYDPTMVPALAKRHGITVKRVDALGTTIYEGRIDGCRIDIIQPKAAA